MDTETSSPVSCDMFDSSFHKEDIEVMTITSPDGISNFMQMLDSLDSGLTFPNTFPIPDTRAKIRIYSKDLLADEICIGKFTILRDNDIYLYTNEFLVFMDSLYPDPFQPKQQQAKALTEFDITKQYKGFLGEAMGIMSFGKNNNFMYEIEGSFLKNRLTGIYSQEGDIIICVIQKSDNHIFEVGDTLRFMLKEDSIYPFTTEKEADLKRPLARIR
ncbi:MAG: hypothetical protein LBN74_07720 [Prevotella sp.]|nr:hypothetical protein [Prevotella sp.]